MGLPVWNRAAAVSEARGKRFENARREPRENPVRQPRSRILLMDDERDAQQPRDEPAGPCAVSTHPEHHVRAYSREHHERAKGGSEHEERGGQPPRDSLAAQSRHRRDMQREPGRGDEIGIRSPPRFRARTRRPPWHGAVPRPPGPGTRGRPFPPATTSSLVMTPPARPWSGSRGRFEAGCRCSLRTPRDWSPRSSSAAA